VVPRVGIAPTTTAWKAAMYLSTLAGQNCLAGVRGFEPRFILVNSELPSPRWLDASETVSLKKLVGRVGVEPTQPKATALQAAYLSEDGPPTQIRRLCVSFYGSPAPCAGSKRTPVLIVDDWVHPVSGERRGKGSVRFVVPRRCAGDATPKSVDFRDCSRGQIAICVS